MPDLYIRNAHGNPVPCPDLLTWAADWENPRRREIAHAKVGAARVKTFFLGIDSGDGLLWATLVVGGALDGKGEKHGTQTDALVGHGRMVRLVEEAEAARSCGGKG